MTSRFHDNQFIKDTSLPSYLNSMAMTITHYILNMGREHVPPLIGKSRAPADWGGIARRLRWRVVAFRGSIGPATIALSLS